MKREKRIYRQNVALPPLVTKEVMLTLSRSPVEFFGTHVPLSLQRQAEQTAEI